ncbi:RNA polymerase sigma factor [Euzebya tangerina]|uniref:RNA polymerase sigma factor n=1 Tax=Euzebya tangerina TaxID=591198 RepID=UPI000E30F053|nr:DUF6596 domain-containing protein [Euzebya tangerina]
MTAAPSAAVAAERAARDSYGRLLALLAAGTGDIQQAEDALGDALERALRRWPTDGVPDCPDAWLLVTARNRQRDAWRSAETQRTVALDVVGPWIDIDAQANLDRSPNRRLELLFVCAHPAIAATARSPLMLNTVLGFTAAVIAGAWVIPTRTMATRLVRAKRRIKQAGIPFRAPDADEIEVRMATVLEAVYAANTIEWGTAAPEARQLPTEAQHLAEVLATLAPEDPEVRGLAALVALSAARRSARWDAAGGFVALADQDPTSWSADLIQQGHRHLRAAHRKRSLGRMQLEAAIQALHCARRAGGPPDWPTLLGLHEDLHAIAPSLASQVALAATRAEVQGPEVGLAALDDLPEKASRYQPAWVTRATLLRRLDDQEGADEAFARAIALTHDRAPGITSSASAEHVRDDQVSGRSSRKKVRTSSTKTSGTSMAAK